MSSNTFKTNTLSIIFILVFIFIALFLPFVTFAQNIEYTPLAPLPGTTNDSDKVELATYLPAIFTLLIGLAGALAVLMIIIGGVQYLSTDAISGKQEGKTKIQNALWGLILAIGSFIILSTISPNLTKFDLSFDPVPIGSSFSTTTTPGLGGGSCSGSPCKPGDPWPSDNFERTDLQQKYGISINKTNCAQVGNASCTSVWNVGQKALQGVRALSVACGSACDITITGGSEYWLHGNRNQDLFQNTTSHKPGGNALDLSPDAALDAYIRNSGTPIFSGCANGERYQIGSAIYVFEAAPNPPPSGWAPHWHVCY